MRSSIIFSAVAFLASQVAAQADSVDSLSHGSYIASRMRRRADVNLNSGAYARRRVEARAPEADSTSAMPAMPTATGALELNPTMDETDAACKMVLSSASAPDNSGMAACYNVNFFDNSTGYFQANVMLYMISAPTAPWDKVSSVNMSINFPGAFVKNMSMTTSKMMKREATTTIDTAATPIRRTINARSMTPMLMEAYSFVGNVVAPYDASLTNATTMKMALMPSMTLKATSGSDASPINVTAPAGADFVNGYFSGMYFANKAAEAAAAAAPPAPFVLPGVTLGFFPIGLITIGLWTLLFVSVVGYGTIGRMQWRSAYRSKSPKASGR